MSCIIRSKLSQHVPVPEVYKWCKDDGQVYIYMEFIDGVTLEKIWDGFNEEDRLAVCEQLRCMVDAWRSLEYDSDPAFIDRLIFLAPTVEENTF
jgi:aminoglycoside phosphotransferase (APT) family kinase protein